MTDSRDRILAAFQASPGDHIAAVVEVESSCIGSLDPLCIESSRIIKLISIRSETVNVPTVRAGSRISVNCGGEAPNARPAVHTRMLVLGIPLLMHESSQATKPG